MNPRNYFMPMMRQNPMYINPMISNNYMNFRSGNLLGKLGDGIKSFNWKGLFNGVNKTLNVVNQTIPLVRQAKPMYDNVKSMIRLTKSFRNETRVSQGNNTLPKKFQRKNTSNKLDIKNDNNPIFFI